MLLSEFVTRLTRKTDALVKLLASPDEMVRLKAATRILLLGIRADARRLRKRIEEIEAQLERIKSRRSR